jgi:hypothetical protein
MGGSDRAVLRTLGAWREMARKAGTVPVDSAGAGPVAWSDQRAGD